MHWSSNALSASISTLSRNSFSSIPASLNVAGIPRSIFNFFISFICALLCFWTENYFGITKSKQVIVNFFSGALIPLTMMPGVLQKIAYALPFQGIVYIPSSIFMESTVGRDAMYLILSQIVWCIVLYIVKKILWRCAIKKVVINGG